jgi:hypothetical protein
MPTAREQHTMQLARRGSQWRFEHAKRESWRSLSIAIAGIYGRAVLMHTAVVASFTLAFVRAPREVTQAA